MATVFPITPPPLPAPVQFMPALMVAAAVGGGAFSPVQRVYDWAGSSVWVWSFVLPALREDLAELWVSFLLDLDGPKGTFWFGPPDYRRNRRSTLDAATPTGTPLVNGANQFGEDLITDGWLAGRRAGPGTWLQAGNTLHRVSKPVIVDGGGNATFTVRPRFGVMGRGKYADNSAIEFRNPRGLWRCVTRDQGKWSTDHLMNYSISLDFVEALAP